MKKILSLVLALAMILVVAAATAQTVSVNQGSGSITVSNAEVDKDYTLYKIFDATVGVDGSIAYSTSKDTTNDTVFNKYFEIKNGNVIAKDTLTKAVISVKDGEFQTWVKSFGTKVSGPITATESTLVFSNIAFGYYFVESNVGTMLTIDSANPSAKVIDKNQTNDSDKKIVEGSNKVVINEAGIDENVTFELTEKVKNYYLAEKIYRYVILDQLDPAFTYNKDEVVVIGSKTLVKGTDYTITYNDNVPSFEILIPWTDTDTYAGAHLYDNNSTIVVTYTAKLDPTKINNDPTILNVGKTPNKNIAQLKWFYGSENPATPNGELPEDRTDTYDTQLTVLKKNNKGEILTGAEFTLTTTDGTQVVLVTENYYEVDNTNGTHWKLKDGTYTTQDPNGTIGGKPVDTSVYDSTTTKYALKTRQVIKDGKTTAGAVKTYVDKDGKAKFTGLGVGTYTLTETVVPAGYNKIDPITFKITFDAKTQKFASDNKKIVLDTENNIFDTEVINSQGTELP